MRKLHFTLILTALLILLAGCCQTPEKDQPIQEFVTEYLTPVRIVKAGGVENPEHLLQAYVGQVSTDEPEVTAFTEGGSVLLDFGREIQ